MADLEVDKYRNPKTIQPGDPSDPITIAPGSISNVNYPFVSLEQKIYPVISPLPKERLPPEEPIVEEPAEIRWGKAGSFAHSSRQGPNLKYNVNIKWPTDEEEEEEEEPEIPVLTFTEIENGRKTQTRRIMANNGDPDVWVEFQLIDDITFGGDWKMPMAKDGQPYTGPIHLQLILKHPPAST